MIAEKSEAPKEPQKPSEREEFPLIDGFKLVLAPPQYVSQFIDGILESVLASLPPDVRVNPTSAANVRGSLLDGSLQVWAISGVLPNGAGQRPVGIGTTAILTRPFTNDKYLLVFSLYSYAVLRPTCYQDFWQVIHDYAKAQGCCTIELYTENPVVLERARAVGMATMHYCVKEVS